jgi:hypothetical protein
MKESPNNAQVRLDRVSPAYWRVVLNTRMASVARPATQARIKAFRELGFRKPGDVEDRMGFYLGRLGR